MPIQDRLAEEIADGAKAADAAAAGRSITGFGGRSQPSGAEMFGERVTPEPIAARRVEGLSPARATADLSADSPFVRRPRGSAEREREPFGSTEQVLAVPNRPGFRRYWFSDIPGRVDRAKRAGYQHVLDHESNPVGRITDRAEGRGRSSYLMEIPIQWYHEDMARQADELAKRLNDIRRGQAGPGAGDNRYIPKQGISIIGR